MYKDPIWPDIVLMLDGIGIVLFVAWMIAAAIVL